jgi:hypothetical protein
MRDMTWVNDPAFVFAGASSGLSCAAAEAVADAPQSLLRIISYRLNFGHSYQLNHDLRVKKSDHHALRRFFAHDDVARQQQADVGHCLQCLVSQRWITCAQDAVCRHVGTKLLLHGSLHIDVAEDAEALDLECGDGLCQRLIER